MEFVTIRLGGPGRIVAENNQARLPFTLPAPARGVFALLQSFRLVNPDDDEHLKAVQIRLIPLFNAAVSTTQGEVEIDTTFRDDGGGILISSPVIEIEVDVLVVGV